MMTDKKSFTINRSTRSTGMGAYDTSALYSLRQQKELSPHKSRSSRTGNHGELTWFLLPGKYIEVWCSFSNSGKGGWHIDTLSIDDQGDESREHLKDPPDWLKPLVDQSVWESVYPTPYE